MDIISVVLGADTKKDRTKDSIKIIEYAFGNYQMIDLGYILHEKFDKVVENEKFEIIKGKNQNIRLKLEENNIGFYPINKENVKDIHAEVTIKTVLDAPVSEGDKLRQNLNLYRRRYNI